MVYACIESHFCVWLVLFSRASGKVALALDIGKDEVILYFILCDDAYSDVSGDTQRHRVNLVACCESPQISGQRGDKQVS